MAKFNNAKPQLLLHQTTDWFQIGKGIYSNSKLKNLNVHQ